MIKLPCAAAAPRRRRASRSGARSLACRSLTHNNIMGLLPLRLNGMLDMAKATKEGFPAPTVTKAVNHGLGAACVRDPRLRACALSLLVALVAFSPHQLRTQDLCACVRACVRACARLHP